MDERAILLLLDWIGIEIGRPVALDPVAEVVGRSTGDPTPGTGYGMMSNDAWVERWRSGGDVQWCVIVDQEGEGHEVKVKESQNGT